MVLLGHKCQRLGLWMIQVLSKNDTFQYQAVHSMWNHHYAHRYNANLSFFQSFSVNVIPTSSKEELVRYYHQCLCSSPKSTMLKAIRKGWLKIFPGLTQKLVAKHLPGSSTTDKGHLIYVRHGMRSTRSMR